jgi:hypothetical protein
MPHADLTGLAARADVSSPMEGMLLQCAGMADVSLRGIRPPLAHTNSTATPTPLVSLDTKVRLPGVPRC